MKEDIIVERNLKGKELEKQGNIEGAIRLYEQNVADKADVPFPYNRLAVIYRKQKRLDDEIRVLEKAIQAYNEIEQNNKWKEQLTMTKEKQQC